MLALFGAPPPQATQTLPRLFSLCLHACADTVCASGDGRLPSPSPLPLLSRYEYEERGVRHRLTILPPREEACRQLQLFTYRHRHKRSCLNQSTPLTVGVR